MENTREFGMGDRCLRFACLFLGLWLLLQISASADEIAYEKEQWRAEINALKDRISVLETKLAQKDEEEKTRKPAQQNAAIESLPSSVFLKEVKLSGVVDVSYVYNTNRPDSGTNTYRVFDRSANAFSPNLVELVLQREPKPDGDVGFRVDLDFGKDAEVFGAAGLGATTDEIDLQQAYLRLTAPLSKVFKLPDSHVAELRFGKFVTLHGAEVIESKDNWNFSRSLLFGYAIPFTHTGLRGYYNYNGIAEGYFGVVNGWDNVNDNNKSKSIEGRIALSPIKELFSFSPWLNVMWGAEQPNDDGNKRTLIDVGATVNPFEKLTLMVNADYGWERGAFLDPNGNRSKDNAIWRGIALYGKYDISDWWSLATRGEYFQDLNGTRTGIYRQGLYEVTATSEFKLYKNLITRLEYRHDESTTMPFVQRGEGVDHQDTVSAEMIYPF